MAGGLYEGPQWDGDVIVELGGTAGREGQSAGKRSEQQSAEKRALARMRRLQRPSPPGCRA